MAPRAFVGRRG